MNVRRANGDFVGYATVEQLAAQQRPPFQLRTGCFCNPGACQVPRPAQRIEWVSYSAFMRGLGKRQPMVVS